MVAALDGDVAVVGIEGEHVTIMPDRVASDWRKSDATISRRTQSPATGT
jgi:hypothetical protein